MQYSDAVVALLLMTFCPWGGPTPFVARRAASIPLVKHATGEVCMRPQHAFDLPPSQEKDKGKAGAQQGEAEGGASAAGEWVLGWSD